MKWLAIVVFLVVLLAGGCQHGYVALPESNIVIVLFPGDKVVRAISGGQVLILHKRVAISEGSYHALLDAAQANTDP